MNTDLTILNFAKTVLQNKFFVIGVTLTFAILSVVIALNLPVFYKSQAILEVNNKSEGNVSSFASRYSGLASAAGIALPSSLNDRTDYVIALIKSRYFLKEILKKSDVAPEILIPERYVSGSKELILNDNYFDQKNRKWIKPYGNSNEGQPSYLTVHREFRENLSISKDNLTGFITISYEHPSPVFAFEMLNLIIDEANNITREKDLTDSEKSIEYLRNESNKDTGLSLRNSINNLIEVQLEIKMLTNIKEDYILSYIEPPFLPERKSRPSRSLVCITITFLGFLFSLIYVLVFRFLRKEAL